MAVVGGMEEPGLIIVGEFEETGAVLGGRFQVRVMQGHRVPWQSFSIQGGKWTRWTDGFRVLFFLGCGDSKDCYVASCRSLPLVSTLLVEVPYVITTCDLHCYYDSEGKKHTCRKRVQAKDGTPGEVAKAKRRLLWWLYAGPSSSLLHLLNRLNALLGHDQHAPGPTCSEFPSL